MRKTWMAAGLLSLLALSASAKVGPETLIHGPYLIPSAAQLNVAAGGSSDVLLFAWTENGRVWVKSSLSSNAIMLPSNGSENVRVGGVAYNQGLFLVAWLQDGVPLAARVSREGALLDGVPFRLGPATLRIDAIPDPVGFRVFLDQQQNGFGMSRITADGRQLDVAPIAIGSGLPQTAIQNADRYAWLQTNVNQPSTAAGSIVVRFNSRVANDFAFPGILSFAAGGVSSLPFMEPALATNGSMYLMAYHNGHEIRGARLNADGTPIDPANGLLLAVDAIAPSASPKPLQAVWDGARYVAVWEDVRADGNVDIKGAYITTTAAPTWFDVAASASSERAPELVLLDPGRVLVVYQKIGPLSTEIVSRVISEKRERAAGR